MKLNKYEFVFTTNIPNRLILFFDNDSQARIQGFGLERQFKPKYGIFISNLSNPKYEDLVGFIKGGQNKLELLCKAINIILKGMK